MRCARLRVCEACRSRNWRLSAVRETMALRSAAQDLDCALHKHGSSWNQEPQRGKTLPSSASVGNRSASHLTVVVGGSS
jgi:hypothetical protein